MKVYIQALELDLNPEELKKAISPEKLKEIQGKGILQAYTLAHEGISKPKVLGQGHQILKWPRAVIQKLAQIVKTGTKFFIGHGETNEHDDRASVGEVVGSFIKELSGKISNIIVGYFPDEEKVEKMDVCSMEADIYTDEENIVGDINEISGIALGSSNEENPAFPGALKLSTVQCFVSAPGQNKHDEEKVVTFDEVRKAVRDMNILPRQLFTIDDLKNDRDFSKIFTENTTLKVEKERLEKEKKEVEDKGKEAIKKIEKSDASTNLDELMKEGYTDKQKEFIKKRFKPETHDDLSKENLEKYLEKEKKEFTETAKLFGVTEESGSEEKGKKKEQTSEELTMEEEALKEIGAV